MPISTQITITLYLSPEDFFKVQSDAFAISETLEDYVRQRLNLDKLPESVPKRPVGRPSLDPAERLKREAQRKVELKLAKWIAVDSNNCELNWRAKAFAARELLARVADGREPQLSMEAHSAFTRYALTFGMNSLKDMPPFKDFPANGRDLPKRPGTTKKPEPTVTKRSKRAP